MSREFVRVGEDRFRELAALHLRYKAEIGETTPSPEDLERLRRAMAAGQILFFACLEEGRMAGCCSVAPAFTTFDYRTGGVFEDFYILPEFRRQGIARQLVSFAYRSSGVGSLTVGAADCDRGMYAALGFSLPLGNLLAYQP